MSLRYSRVMYHTKENEWAIIDEEEEEEQQRQELKRRANLRFFIGASFIVLAPAMLGLANHDPHKIASFAWRS
ncbi:hypothetical protein CkaCkLH20_09018 [Colletotrichum karsti]|uniref:Uncharacterized protein n=1 Tax=Colletotrichum karsti TaxID=1095194 RepID=A0A9P6HZK1_9PEZI|nr:uncharacterized protein CkaCkLH20_09018 [Colletotrichum karsti]KAF9873559.1 hypothetical protein CkaCkLH20_09018 [Colletotrichum karsti]